MKRRDFIQKAGLSAGAMMLPFTGFGREVDIAELLTPIFDVQQKKQLADVALNTAKSLGASYADVRIGRYLNQFVTTRERRVQGVANTESFGVGVRVIANGTWGFGATNVVTTEGIKKATEKAVAIAKANSKFQKEPVKLAANPAYGEVSWRTPIVKNAFEVPVKDKVDLLLAANAKAMEKGASFVNSQMFLINEQKYFASTEGSYIDQDVFRIQPGFNVSMVDRQSGSFKSRSAFSAPVGMGYEYLDGKAEDKIKGPGGIILYNKSYDIIEDATMAAEQAKEMIAAKSVEAGKYDLVLEPSHMWLTIHESVGHPTELDRVLGYEANYAGTSFLTFDKWQSKKFKFGSDIVNFVADKTQVGSLGNVGYDDEGVKCKKWDLIKDGVLVNYQAIRDQVNILGQKESHGCCYAQSWSDVQFQRMPNVSLQPGKQQLTPEQMISGVDKGIYIVKDGSFSIDQQRYNFQFGGVLFFEIKNGKIAGMLKDVAYQANTQEFWNSCVAICDERDYRLNGAFSDGKGQPSQSNSVSHGSATARFNGVNVINTGRTI
ncbi:MAG TPA: TldD/PmbA family protein [Cyclobacteriaceae bacterium]|jgi:TldD protein|nr:TldD/PmbA family protein [Cytophagales bacterium]HMR56533.1 TldD/PmbA family protein [Cyclobacteriaceae bacterium]HRE68239.1 TldD/PmbA family protein [Cyclobacteriaceae bacterium]HRF34313.1 TldD/PmbA family protein [Cyclobacteriaceae bacterium]